ncbi:putative nucleotidyltransferase substrate binding domain-containing protein [Persephonella sp.]
MSLDIKKFLQETPPFSYLSERELVSIVESSYLDYVPEDSLIVEENQTPEYVYLIVKGSAVLKKDGITVDILEKGDTIGDSAVLLEQPYQFSAKTLEDSILLLIPAEKFRQTAEKIPDFKEFFTRETLKKLAEGYRRLQETPDDISLMPVKEFPLKPAVFCREDESIAEVARRMSEKVVSYCILGDESSIKGIITDRDLKDRVLAKGLMPENVKASQVKTYPVETVESDRFIFEAVLKMVRKNIKRIPVVENKKVIGIIEDRDIFIRQSKNIVHFIHQIEKENDIKVLKELYISVEESIEPIFKTGKDIEILQKYISEINDRFTQKAVELALEEIGKKGRFTFFVFGSEGRKEQTINTDIDNGIAFTEGKREDILEIGRRAVEILIEIGFPRCEGNVMASNPQWVRTVDEWKKIIENWILEPTPSNIMYTAIFFDLRAVYGDQSTAEKIREHIFKTVNANKNFLVLMTMKALDFEPPIGFFKEFIVEKSGEHKNELDIKKGGIFPVVQGIRVLSMENRISETNTIDRIRMLKNKIGENLSDELIESFKFMQALRLKNQLEKIKEGKKPDNYINPEKLSKFEKDLLKDAFKIVKKFQDMLGVHFRLRV